MGEAPEEKVGAGARPTPWLRRQCAAYRTRLTNLNDTPHSVALGSAVGMFFGFTPLFGLKTLLSILLAWLFRSNKLAAAIMVTLHDVILPFAPVLYYWEYQIGSWAWHGHFAPRPRFRHIALRDYMEWTTFFTLGRPTLLGSLFLGLPSAVIVYFLVRTFLSRARLALEKEAPPS